MELKTEVLLWERIQCFQATCALLRRNLKTKQSPVILDLRLRKTRSEKSPTSFPGSSFSRVEEWGPWERGWKIAWSWLWRHRYRRASFSKCFLSTRKPKAGVFKFLCFEERYRKVPFSWRISGDGRLNRRNNTTFSNTSGVVWTLLKITRHSYDWFFFSTTEYTYFYPPRVLRVESEKLLSLQIMNSFETG